MSGQSLAVEAARRRHQLREEQARHAVTRAALRDANRLLLRLALRGRLEDPRDFLLHAGGLDRVVDEEGRLDWARVEQIVEAMLQDRPHLAKRGDVHADSLLSALRSEMTEAHTRGVSAHGAQGASRAGQGPAGADLSITESR